MLTEPGELSLSRLCLLILILTRVICLCPEHVQDSHSLYSILSLLSFLTTVLVWERSSLSFL